MTGLRIERAGPADAATLGHIHARAWRDAYAGIVPDSYLAEKFSGARRTAFFERILPMTANEHYLLFRDNEPVGMLALGEADHEHSGNDGCGEIIALYLLAPAWGRGIGRAAVDFAVHRLGALGYGDTVLTVLCDNTRARRFYARYGFVPDGGPEPIELGVTLLEMQYRLKRSEMTGP